MREYAAETAYYLNGKLPQVALIAKGLRFPPGRWIRVTGELVLPWHVQELVSDLFPALSARVVPLLALLTEFDVEQFERHLENEPGGLAQMAAESKPRSAQNASVADGTRGSSPRRPSTDAPTAMPDPGSSVRRAAIPARDAGAQRTAKKVVLVVEEVGEWRVTRYIADQTVSGVPIGGGKDISKLDHWWGAGWRLANASGFPVRTSAASEGPSPVDRVLLVVEQD